MKATTINEVITSLDKIILQAKLENSRLGYFAALYRKITIRVKERIEKRAFHQNEIMEKLDVNFANRYLEAYDLQLNGGITTLSWKISFGQCKYWRPIVLQHLLAGMNAHISLDLGIAAAETMKGKNLYDIKEDFIQINDLLVSMINEVQDDLAEVWPSLKHLDKFTGEIDEKFSGFGMVIARNSAWKIAEEIWILPADQWNDKITEIDSKVEKMSAFIVNPGWKIYLLLLWIRIKERQTVSEVIDLLS